MKKILIIFFFYLFQFNFVSANINVVFIDMDLVISTSKVGSSIMKQLSDVNTKNSNKFKKEAQILKEKETKLISQKNILAEVDFQSNVNNLKSEIKNYNDNRNKINNDFKKLKIDSTNRLLKLINPILIKYSNEKSISLILQKKNLLIGKAELDITNEIIKIINNDIAEFKIQ
jgi:outer membrane protein